MQKDYENWEIEKKIEEKVRINIFLNGTKIGK